MDWHSPNLIQLQKTMIATHGEAGEAWWQQLPAVLNTLAKKENATLQTPYPQLSCNYAAPVVGPNKEQWVLKCSVPNNEFCSEVNALKQYAGVGSVKLIKANTNVGWMLIDRCLPGTRLVDLKDESKNLLIAVQVIQQLWQPLKDKTPFPALKDWLKGLNQMEIDPILMQILPRFLRHFASARSQELLSDMRDVILLHADLHHYNILQHQEDWIAIDPKGVLGEKEYELGAFLRNPMPVVEHPVDIKAIDRKLSHLIELTGFDRQKVLSWAIVQAVLCACWYVEDGMASKAKQMSAFAERLYALQ